MRGPIPEEFDAVVVGAGPAGASAAIALRRYGLSVALLEKTRFPRHKICGDFLSPGAVESLRAIDGGLTAASPARLTGMRLTFEGAAVLSDFPPSRCGWSFSRRGLDAALAHRAAEEGARCVEELRVTRCGRDPDGARWVEGSHPDGTRRAYRARLLVEAGGRHGPFSARLGWLAPETSLRRYAIWSHMEGVRGLTERGEMHVFRGGYVGVAPFDEGRGRGDPGAANVTMVLGPELWARARGDVRGSFFDLLKRQPELGRRVAGARLLAPLRGSGPLALTSRRKAGDGLALVGDATGFVDPFTGEGVFVALESARLMASAFADGALARYEADWRAAFSAKFRLCRLLQCVISRPRLARFVARALASRKDLADRMAGATGDLLPPGSVLNPAYVGRLLLAGMTG